MKHWDAEQATHELLAVLPLLNRIVAAEIRHEAGDDTTMPQFRVLSHLAAAPLTVSALARERRVSLQAMGELVQALVERGWIIRTPDPRDRRQSLLSLSAEGHSQYDRAQAATMRRIAPLLALLSQNELAAVQVALPALHRVLIGEDTGDGDGKTNNE